MDDESDMKHMAQLQNQDEVTSAQPTSSVLCTPDVNVDACNDTTLTVSNSITNFDIDNTILDVDSTSNTNTQKRGRKKLSKRTNVLVNYLTSHPGNLHAVSVINPGTQVVVT